MFRGAWNAFFFYSLLPFRMSMWIHFLEKFASRINIRNPWLAVIPLGFERSVYTALSESILHLWALGSTTEHKSSVFYLLVLGITFKRAKINDANKMKRISVPINEIRRRYMLSHFAIKKNRTIYQGLHITPLHNVHRFTSVIYPRFYLTFCLLKAKICILHSVCVCAVWYVVTHSIILPWKKEMDQSVRDRWWWCTGNTEVKLIFQHNFAERFWTSEQKTKRNNKHLLRVNFVFIVFIFVCMRLHPHHTHTSWFSFFFVHRWFLIR